MTYLMKILIFMQLIACIMHQQEKSRSKKYKITYQSNINQMQSSVDLSESIRSYVSTDTDASLASLILGEREMTKQAFADSAIIKFKSISKKKQFISSFEMPPTKSKAKPTFSYERLASNFSQKISEEIRQINEDQSSFYGITNIFQEKYCQLIKEEKDSFLEEDLGKVDKIQKMKYFITNILETLDVGDESLAEEILKNMDLNFLSVHPEISKQPKVKAKIEKILSEVMTFKELRKYGGSDIEYETNKLERQLISQLSFSEKINKEVFQALLKDPSSNIVAKHQKISDFQKNAFYNSKFYRSKQLLNYYQMLKYPECELAKIHVQIGNIINFISESSKLTPEMFKLIQNFDLQKLFQIKNLNTFISDIFNFIYKECENYYEAYKKVRFLRMKASSLKINRDVDKRFELRDYFIKIELPFRDWEAVEQNIFKQNFEILDQIPLTLEKRMKLWNYINECLYSYIDEKANTLSFRDQVAQQLEIFLIQSQIMTPYSNFLVITNEYLEFYESQSSKSLSEYDKTIIAKGIVSCQKFQQYKKNQQIDFGSIKLKVKRHLLYIILVMNYQNKIQVSYQDILIAVEKFLDHPSLQIIRNINKYICDLERLGIFCGQSDTIKEYVRVFSVINSEIKLLSPQVKQQIIEEISKDEQPQQFEVFSDVQNKIDVEEIKRQKDQLIKSYIKKYKDAFDQSTLTQIFTNTSPDDEYKIAQRILELDPYSNPNIQYEGLNFNNVKKNKVNKECAEERFKEAFKDYVDRYSRLEKLLAENKVESPKKKKESAKEVREEPKKETKEELQLEKKKLLNQFNDLHDNKFKESIYFNLLDNKREEGMSLAQRVLEANPYENGDAVVLGLNGVQNKKLMKFDCTNEAIKADVAGMISKYKEVSRKLKQL